MKYMLLIYGPEDSWNDEERAECMVESLGICDELAAQGKFIDASPLQPVKTAASVRVRQGRTLVTAGPFAETAEQLGGYFVVDLADLDEAISLASRLPPATKGTVEIRPMAPLDGLPAAKPITAVPTDDSRKAYLLLCYDDEAAWAAAGPEGLAKGQAKAVSLAHRLAEGGRYLSASPLHLSGTATCVRVRGGRRVITDGPFAETHEVLGGYYLILAEDRETALQFASQHPGTEFGSVEVRPVFDMAHLRQLT